VSQLDEVEYANLSDQVRQIEALINSGQSGDVSHLLKSFLHNAKSRMEEIRHEEVRAEQDKKEQQAKEAASLAQLVEMEHQLNPEEKQQYAGFLKLDYFTKANFSDLNQFYSNTWDKLSESGKTQMSTRVWEGIRQGEYTFAELPENIRKKEAERLYEQLTGKQDLHPALTNIPAQDRADFVREYEAGNEQAVAAVLSRKSFSLNVSTHSTSEASRCDPSLSSKIKADDPKNRDKSAKESNDATEDLSTAGVVFANATEIARPLVRNPGAGSVVERS
jgi:hypothetical protein